MTLPKAPLRLISMTLVVVALCGCSGMRGAKSPEERTVAITILHTNDHHGRFWKNRDGEYGMAARKTIVDSVRAEVAAAGGYTLLLDGGDVNTGVPESDLQNAVPDFRGMNLLGYDAMAVGNHEFDKSPAVLQMQRELVTFPMLSANIYRQGQRMFASYKIFILGGVKVAVLGLTTEDTQKMVHPDNIRDVDFRNPIAEAASLVPELRRSVDVVVAATHMGHYADGQHGTQAPGDVELARAVPGLDLVVGGHTQNPACMKAENVLDQAYVPGTPCQPDRQNGTWIVQAHEWGKYVGRADFTYAKGKLELVRYSLVPVNLMKQVKGEDGKPISLPYTQAIAEDVSMLALLRPYQEYGQKQLLVEIGQTDAMLDGDRTHVRSRPTSLGVLVGRAMMDKVKADFAVVNSGGVRDSLPAGVLTYKDILKVHPFGNTIGYVDLKGSEVIDYLNVAAKMSLGSGAFPQFAGVQIVIEHGDAKEVMIHGQLLDVAKTYRMAINNFMASGGDGYPKLVGHPGYADSGFVDADVLRGYIASRSPLKADDYAPGTSVVRR